MKVLLIFISKSRLFAQCLKMYECHMFVYIFIQISAVCLQLEKNGEIHIFCVENSNETFVVWFSNTVC